MLLRFSRCTLTIIMFLLTLVACTSAKNVVTAIASPSSTSVPPTATSTETPTPTSTPVAMTERCAEILPAFPEGRVPPGILVLSPAGELSLLNFREHTKRSIAGDFWTVGASPNGKWLSYVIFTPIDNGADVTMDLIVESTDGEKQAQLSFDPNWFTGIDIPWLDNERMWFPVLNKKDVNPPTLVLNPFTGEQQILLADYPNFNPYYYGPVGTPPLFFDDSNVAYDPSLRYVAYPQNADDGLYVALWDRETERTVAKVFSGGLYELRPLWLPDGSAFVVAAFPDKDTPLREWFLMGGDGEIRQLTHLGKLYSKYGFGQTASLSPDGRYLVFGLYVGDFGPRDLVILDLHTLEMVNTCLKLSTIPFWSPDSQYLAVSHWDADKMQSSVIVLDVEEGWAATVFTDDNEAMHTTLPRGWLVSGE